MWRPVCLRCRCLPKECSDHTGVTLDESKGEFKDVRKKQVNIFPVCVAGARAMRASLSSRIGGSAWSCAGGLSPGRRTV